MLPLPELLLTLSPPVFRALLAALGPLPGLPERPGPKAPPSALARAVFTASAAGRLSSKPAALFAATLPRFATRSGRLALVEAARAVGDLRADAWLALPAADVAATLAIELLTTKGRPRQVAKRLFALADQRLDRDLPERPTYELLAETSAPEANPPAPSSIAARLRQRFGETLVELWDAVEDDGAPRFALLLAQPGEIRLVRDATSRDRVSARADAPVALDEVRVFSDAARVAITTAMPERLRAYAGALGLSLRPAFSFRKLHVLSPADLAALRVPGVARIEVVGVRLRGPNMLRSELRGPDALAELQRRAIPGYIDRATIRVTLDDGRKADAFVQLPHRFDLSNPLLERPVRAALDALGLFTPGALPDDARSLFGADHGDWRWRAVIESDHFDRLCALGRFVRVDAPHVVSEEHRMHGAGYVVREVPGEGGIQYALAEDRSLGARIVSAKDRVAWRLDLDALARAMRRDIGAAAADPPLAIVGLLDLGIVAIQSGRLRFVYVMGEPPEGWVEQVRRACGVGVTPVLFVPRGHTGDAKGMLEVELDVAEQLGAKSLGRALGRAAQALGVADQVELWRLCDEGVVVNPSTKSVWVLGVLVSLGERAFRLLAELTSAAGQVISSKELGTRISNAGAPDVTTRKAKAELENAVRRALGEAGLDASLAGRLVEVEGRRGYRLGVPARVVGGS